ncbi:mechanosensitive ion channel [Arthrobacter sp. H35-D1]|nr:mechanosensitive ion channel domain-containing protein [Arthrobacter sp. H35-D1]MDJ0312496.1 mechanosensitive ion channel [Arthrobacter sp. H35-D1]
MKDYLSGIFLVAENQFGMGNHVDRGEVRGVGLRITQVRDVVGRLCHVRNGEILRVGSFSQCWSGPCWTSWFPTIQRFPR